MLHLKKNKKMFSYNFKTLIKFQLIYKSIMVILALIYLYLFRLIIQIGEYKYFNYQNVVLFLNNPLVVLMLLIFIIGLFYCIFIDINSVIVIYDKSYRKENISVEDTFFLTYQNIKKITNWKNIFLLIAISIAFCNPLSFNFPLTIVNLTLYCIIKKLFIFILYLFLMFIFEINYIISPTFVTTITIPGFILYFLRNNTFIFKIFFFVNNLFCFYFFEAYIYF